MYKIIICIPARFKSTRLPGKPLLQINGKSIIQRVYENASKVNGVNDVVVLTDDDRIVNEINKINGKSAIITNECLNGTDRIIKYIQKYDVVADIIVNVQGDEPFIHPENIELAIQNFINKKLDDQKIVCSTLYYESTDNNEIKNKNRGKVVLDHNNNIMYCSRNVIPSGKKNDVIEGYNYKIDIGIFVYDKDYLLNHYCKHNTPIQLCEDIEWLKIIEDGFKINTIKCTHYHEIGVDTIEDYEYLLNKYGEV